MPLPPNTLGWGTAALLLTLFATQAVGQSIGSTTPGNSINTPRPFDPGQNTTNPSALASQAQNPFLGSVPTGTVIPGIVPLSMHQAVTQALRSNLGLIDAFEDDRGARARRIRALSVLLPQLTADSTQEYRTLVNAVVDTTTVRPAYNVQTAHIGLAQRLLDVGAAYGVASASRELEASRAVLSDARNIVVLAATSSYLLVAADQIRLETAQAQLVTAQATEVLLHDRVAHDVSPQIEAIRAQVVRRSAEQRVALATAAFEKDKLALTRIIGLPIAQEFRLTDTLTFTALTEPSLGDLREIVESKRQDIHAAAARVQSAADTVHAQSAQRLPVIDLRASAGETGFNYARSVSDYEVAARVSIPVFTGRRIEADVLAAKAVQDRRQAELADLRARADYDVRTTLIDLRAALTSVQVSEDNVVLAKEGLRQANDRYSVGVTNSLQRIQAEQDVAEAADNRISSIYAYSLAKLMLIRATGTAEENYQLYLGVH